MTRHLMTIETTITLYPEDVRKAIRTYIKSLNIFSDDILIGEVRFHNQENIIVEIEDPINAKFNKYPKAKFNKYPKEQPTIAYYEKEEESEAESDIPF